MFLKVLVIGCLVAMEMSYVMSAPQGCDIRYFCRDKYLGGESKGEDEVRPAGEETPIGSETLLASEIPATSQIQVESEIPVNSQNPVASAKTRVRPASANKTDGQKERERLKARYEAWLKYQSMKMKTENGRI